MKLINHSEIKQPRKHRNVGNVEWMKVLKVGNLI